MAGPSGRGAQARAVAEFDAAYDDMVRRQRAYNARQEAAEAKAAAAKKGKGYWETHPGLGESMVPVWGSAREAIADYHEGDIIGAVGNGALALTDLTGQGYVVKSLYKGGAKLAGSHTWDATRKWMSRKGNKPEGLHGHHWLIPQNGWGKAVPEALKNQPWNIKVLPGDTHKRMHTRDLKNGKPKFSATERYVHGTPTWWKVQNGVWAAGAANGAQEGLNPRARDDR